MSLSEKYQQQITQAAAYSENVRRSRYIEIKNELGSTIMRQITMGAMKAIAAVACLFFIYTTRSNQSETISSATQSPNILPTNNSGNKFIVRALLLAGAAALSYACSINYLNYRSLNMLLAKLRRDYNV